MMRLATFPVGPLRVNCVVLGCPETGAGLVVDPGGDLDKILASVGKLGLKVERIVLTHGHVDHAAAARALAKATGAPIAVHRDDLEFYFNIEGQARWLGITCDPPAQPSQLFDGGDVIPFGALAAKVLHTPGHTPGSACLLVERADQPPLLLAGDTLFAGSIGRTDQRGGSSEKILRSIRDVLLVLPDETTVIPGHGVHTTIGREREHNPFVGRRAQALEE